MAEINGVVEAIEGRTVAGWARAHGTPGPVRVTVLLGEAEIGSGELRIARADLGGEFGFSIACTTPPAALAALAGELRVLAQTQDCRQQLPIVPPLRARLLAGLITETMHDARLEELEPLRHALANLPGLAGADAPLAELAERQRTQLLLRRAGWQPDAPAPPSFLPIRAGFVSPDGSAVVGHDGEVYLVGGGNHVLEQFLAPEDDPATEPLVVAWLGAIVERARLLEAAGCRFQQLLIPEKLSVYPEKFPAPLAVPSPLLARLEAALAGSPVAARVVFGRRELLAALRPAQIFPRLDTHLTTLAAHALFIAILRNIGFTSFPLLDLSGRETHVGDLALRLFGVELPEEYAVPGRDFAERSAAEVRLVAQEIPAEGHQGTRLVWQNRAAPLDIKVVAFANSFFERGGNARSLSWWCCRAFREFHFIWSPDLDMDYVRAAAPDWVFCQTIERFLVRPPQDRT